MRLKKKEMLTAYWDKKENCIGAYHPLGFMTQTDAHYLFDNVFTKEFVKEMTDRGYEGAENKRNSHFQVERATDKGK